MPTTIVRNGKRYIEYTPQELAEKKLQATIRDYVLRGQPSLATSNLTATQTGNHKKGVR